MIQISENYDVRSRATELECHIPTSLALLPRNFETAKSKNELLHESTTPTIRTLWKQNGIAETKIEDGEKIPYIQENAFDWIAPTIFISTALLSQNPHIISVALGVISNYLTDWFRGIPESNKVKIDIVVETKSGAYKRVRYEGDPDGLKNLPDVIREVNNG
jgi:hypothetical protein